MRGVTRLVMAVTCAGGAATAAPAQRTVETVLARVQAAEDATRDVTLKFRQTTTLRATAESQETRGEVALLRSPERFRVRFTAPVRQVAVYDGARLWLHLEDAAQAFRQRARASDLARLIGLNPAEPVRSFRQGFRASLDGCDGEGCRLSFTREGPAAMTWRVRVSSTDWRLAEATFENDEVRVTLACYDYRVNRGLKAAAFRVVLPKDVEVTEGIPFVTGGPRP